MYSRRNLKVKNIKDHRQPQGKTNTDAQLAKSQVKIHFLFRPCSIAVSKFHSDSSAPDWPFPFLFITIHTPK